MSVVAMVSVEMDLNCLKTRLALKLVEIFLKTKFEGGRHLKRLKKI